MTANFIIRKDRVGDDGRTHIYCLLIQDRKKVKFSIQQKIEVKYWLGKSPKWVKDGHPNANRLNFLLNQELHKIESILLDYKIRSEIPDLIQVKKQYLLGDNVKWYILHDLFIKHQEQLNKSKSTIRMYNSRMNKLMEYDAFLKVKDINLDWIERFEHWLIIEKGNSLNTRYKAHEYVRKVLTLAAKEKIIIRNPYEDFKVKKEINEPSHLNFSEIGLLQELYDSTFLVKAKPGVANVLRYFLFACFTGLDYRNILALRYEDFLEISGILSIKSKRIKNGNPFCVPVTEQAKRYVDWTKKTGKVFNVISNNQTNLHLKYIGMVCGIAKSINFHMGRHSFATMSLNLGVSKEILQHWLGHKSIIQTEHYAKMLDNTAVEAGTNWKNYGKKIQ